MAVIVEFNLKAEESYLEFIYYDLNHGLAWQKNRKHIPYGNYLQCSKDMQCKQEMVTWDEVCLMEANMKCIVCLYKEVLAHVYVCDI